jgi:hypothetical protein
MISFFENNLILFVFSYVVAFFAWKYCIKLKSARVRRAVRASIAFLVFPILEIPHPIIFTQTWMEIIMCTYLLVPICLIILSIGWFVFLVFSQVRISEKNEN